jgi:hypothetical protein
MNTRMYMTRIISTSIVQATRRSRIPSRTVIRTDTRLWFIHIRITRTFIIDTRTTEISHDAEPTASSRGLPCSARRRFERGRRDRLQRRPHTWVLARCVARRCGGCPAPHGPGSSAGTIPVDVPRGLRPVQRCATRARIYKERSRPDARRRRRVGGRSLERRRPWTRGYLHLNAALSFDGFGLGWPSGSGRK